MPRTCSNMKAGVISLMCSRPVDEGGLRSTPASTYSVTSGVHAARREWSCMLGPLLCRLGDGTALAVFSRVQHGYEMAETCLAHIYEVRAKFGDSCFPVIASTKSCRTLDVFVVAHFRHPRRAHPLWAGCGRAMEYSLVAHYRTDSRLDIMGSDWLQWDDTSRIAAGWNRLLLYEGYRRALSR